MKKLLTFFACVLLAHAVKAQAAMQQDTNVTAPELQAPVSIYNNVIFKRRLDSIQKEVPLDYNGYVQAYIDLYSRRRDEMGKMIGLSRYYFPIYEKAFADAGIPDEIKYLSIVESALNPNAISKVGAAGPWQFMSETAKMYGLAMTEYVDERRDPVQASNAAAAYLKDAYMQFGDWLLAIASYNCGKSNVQHALERTGAHDYWSIRDQLPPETRGYVPAFIAVNYVMKYHKYHYITPQSAGLAIITDTVMTSKFVALSRVAQALGMPIKDLAALNPSYRQQIVNGSATNLRRIVVPKLNKQQSDILHTAINDITAPVRPLRPMQYAAINPPPDLPARPYMANAAQQAYVVNGAAITPTIHVTKKGETLSTIASMFNVKVEQLMQWNKQLGGNANLPLLPGLTVNIGNG
ncbi:LysM peptidoglycan-binding domain-containing protein [Mucilaginibacter achroorhodeus]|uniref:LysM peptidoglycan-binding domain-containing protein n=1 Tax=Mucilaginibacter achroorhodeus TaxID=2599294 RepID=A0A563TZP4_9SPHI|nr:lytic transglycosylase domain-containing protein [Mucilaginibacter achroorhodeus]TWR24855.1 LysM peptidoglycan-binding domain-containing protein [Mucilaginibacter achroorhodeus]